MSKHAEALDAFRSQVSNMSDYERRCMRGILYETFRIAAAERDSSELTHQFTTSFYRLFLLFEDIRLDLQHTDRAEMHELRQRALRGDQSAIEDLAVRGEDFVPIMMD